VRSSPSPHCIPTLLSHGFFFLQSPRNWRESQDCLGIQNSEVEKSQQWPLKFRFLWDSILQYLPSGLYKKRKLWCRACVIHTQGGFSESAQYQFQDWEVKFQVKGIFFDPTLFIHQHLLIKFPRVQLEVYYWIQPLHLQLTIYEGSW
jgi:hypothetical protein